MVLVRGARRRRRAVERMAGREGIVSFSCACFLGASGVAFGLGRGKGVGYLAC